jgi:colanic acid/amylovoran biosynthesis protein
MRNIIITGGELFNKGAQAMTYIAVHEIRQRFPEHDIYLLSEMDLARPKSQRDLYTFGFTGWYPVKFARAQKNPLLQLVCRLFSKEEFSEVEKLYRNCDAMIDISGYALGSNWDIRYNNRFLDHLEFARNFQIPMFLMSQSFGPFDFGHNHPGVDDRCRELLPSCRVILAREQAGYDALINNYGLTNVRLAPDLVLNNQGIDLTHVFREPPTLLLPQLLPGSLAIIPNMQTLLADAGEAMALYQAAVHHGLAQGKQVYLLHHATSDAGICAELKACFAQDDRVILLEQEFSCLEFHSLVNQFDYLIASRFHSIVHAFKNGIPCITLGWAQKYEDLAAQFGQLDYLLDIRNSPAPKTIVEKMDQLNLSRTQEQEKILSRLADIQAHNVFDIITL